MFAPVRGWVRSLSNATRRLLPQICAEDEQAASASRFHPVGVALPERLVRETTTTVTKEEEEKKRFPPLTRQTEHDKIWDDYSRAVISLASACLEVGLIRRDVQRWWKNTSCNGVDDDWSAFHSERVLRLVLWFWLWEGWRGGSKTLLAVNVPSWLVTGSITPQTFPVSSLLAACTALCFVTWSVHRAGLDYILFVQM